MPPKIPSGFRWRAQSLLLVCVCAAVLPASIPLEPNRRAPAGIVADSLPAVLPNDNRTAAGKLRDGLLAIRLVAGPGNWSPERSAGPSHRVYAFGESGGALWNPGPLIRVFAGTEVRVVIRNDIAGRTLTVHGLHDRPGPRVLVDVPPGSERRVRFRVSQPGTYYYWATTRGAASVAARFGPESQLNGALVVDPPGARPTDRIFVLGIEDDSAAIPAQRPLRAAVVNGLSWPHSDVTTVLLGDTVRMRWINPTDRRHPMHLHGFYFRVESRGDGVVDTIYEPKEWRNVVTELMNQGGTFTLTWIPDRVGNWLLHCHMADHIAPELRQGSPHSSHGGRGLNHALDVMSGLVVGWKVLPRAGAAVYAEVGIQPSVSEPRQVRLVATPTRTTHGVASGLGFHLQGGAAATPDTATIPGPPLVLIRGEPATIRVVNRLDEPTSIHWHGIELESYFDGVSGWSGDTGRISPHIEPGDSFDVSFSPPRAGTFIYHSHFAELHQLAAGLFGPLMVLEPGTRYDPETDHAWVLSQGGARAGSPVLLNASPDPVIRLRAGLRHRIRLINISPSIPLTFDLVTDSGPATWRPIAKDGADLPPNQSWPRAATLQIGVGETYDFELVPPLPGRLAIRIKDPVGHVRLHGEVLVDTGS